MSNKILLLAGLLAIAGCKAKKQLLAAKKPEDVVAIKTVSSQISKIDSIRAAQLNFNTFSGKAKTELSIGGSSNNVTLNIRIEKGKRIWISITAIAGIEVARALIRPDSILVVNKLQSLYLSKPFNYLYKYASDKLDYSSIEALLVGNAIPQLINNEAVLKADSANLQLTGSLDELFYNLTLGRTMHVLETHLSNQGAGQSLDVFNAQPIQVGERAISSQIDINSVAGTKKVKISLHYNKIDFDKPQEYPFSIPASYEPAK